MNSTQSHERNGEFSIPRSPFPIPRSPFPIPRFGGRSRRNGGFTLIEMLVVIVIIVILMGVVFKLSKGAMAKSTYAREVKRLAIIRTLVEEFHAEYNIYPPIPEYQFGRDFMHFDEYFPDKKKYPKAPVQPFNFTGAYPLDGSAGDLNYYPGHYSPVCDKYFVFGLMSVFVPRDHYCQQAYKVAGKNHDGVNNDWRRDGNNDDVDISGKIQIPQKDRAFTKRVRPILQQIYDCYDLFVDIDADNGHSKGFTTNIKDSWGNPYFYISKPPYTTYLVFSAGPDGRFDWKNPGDRASEDNRDNIYGNLGDK